MNNPKATTWALVIGGSTGMGRATAVELLKRQVGVHLVGRNRSRINTRQIAEQLQDDEGDNWNK
ncbi:MAG: SDR family NAD(P)-dependent oxidoreductase [Pseudomonadota bacterium]